MELAEKRLTSCSVAKKLPDYAWYNSIIMTSDVVTKKDVEEIVGKAVDQLSDIITDLAQSTHNEFQIVHREIAALKADNKRMHESIDRLTNTIDGPLENL